MEKIIIVRQYATEKKEHLQQIQDFQFNLDVPSIDSHTVTKIIRGRCLLKVHKTLSGFRLFDHKDLETPTFNFTQFELDMFNDHHIAIYNPQQKLWSLPTPCE